MKIKTKKQFLFAIIVINIMVFSLVGMALYYYDGMGIFIPLLGGAIATIVMQYKSGRKKFTEV